MGQEKADQEYEYRVTGRSGSGWSATDWHCRSRATRLYAEVDWPLVGFERRRPGDDSTIQRQREPGEDSWMDVTTETIHIKGEQVSGTSEQSTLVESAPEEPEVTNGA